MLDPGEELVVAQVAHLVHEINQLHAGAVKLLGLGFERIGMAVVGVDGLKHFIHTIIDLVVVAFDMEPQSAIIVAYGSPHARAAEQFVAEQFPHVGRVVLEPLEVQFAHTLDGVGVVIDIFAQVQPEVGVMPVGVVALVHASAPALGASARGVALETQAHAVDDRGLPVLDKCSRCHHIFGSEGVVIIQRQQPVPLVSGHINMDFGDGFIVPDVVVSLLDVFGKDAA